MYPERLDHFMARAAAAYYARPDSPFGRAGDFTTAPEISQAFGEVIGLWCAVMWERMGRPDPVMLVECGPGRGTLMSDALRAVAEVAAPFRAAARVHLVETSPALRAVQARVVPGATWHGGVATVPRGPVLVIANEFLDALPVRQFVMRDTGWVERYVEGGAFVEVAVPSPLPPPARGGGRGRRELGELMLPDQAAEGAIKEVSEPALAWTASVAARIAAHSGAAIILDYGPTTASFGDTLQAVSRHATGLDPLAAPGTRDLTAHVDFAAIAHAARDAGAATHGPIPQGLFLLRLGLMTRAAMLAQARPRLAGEILSGAERLVAAEGMGRLFKALALCDHRLGPPPGFEEP